MQVKHPNYDLCNELSYSNKLKRCINTIIYTMSRGILCLPPRITVIQPIVATTFVIAIHRGTPWNAVMSPWQSAVTGSIKYVDKNTSAGVIGQ